jgi:hypothetical protein
LARMVAPTLRHFGQGTTELFMGLTADLGSCLCGRGSNERGFEDFDGLAPFVESRYGVDIKIHAERMTELIGNQLRINPRLPGHDMSPASRCIVHPTSELAKLEPMVR